MKIIFTLYLFIMASVASAISIPCDRTPEEEINRAEVIVVASVESHELNPEGVGNIKFKVERQWKGGALKHMNVYANAHWSFSEGESGYYLIYARRSTHAEPPVWVIPWCKPITDVTHAGKELYILGKPKYTN